MDSVYLEVFQYDPSDHQQVNSCQQEIRDFINLFPQFEIEKIETLIINDEVTIHFWYTEKNESSPAFIPGDHETGDGMFPGPGQQMSGSLQVRPTNNVRSSDPIQVIKSQDRGIYPGESNKARSVTMPGSRISPRSNR